MKLENLDNILSGIGNIKNVFKDDFVSIEIKLTKEGLNKFNSTAHALSGLFNPRIDGKFEGLGIILSSE